MSHSGHTDPLIPALSAQLIKNSSSGLGEPYILQDEGHQLLSNTTHTADFSSKALDTAPNPRVPPFSNHPYRHNRPRRRLPSSNDEGASFQGLDPDLTIVIFLASPSLLDFICNWICPRSYCISWLVFRYWFVSRVPSMSTVRARAQSQRQRHNAQTRM